MRPYLLYSYLLSQNFTKLSVAEILWGSTPSCITFLLPFSNLPSSLLSFSKSRLVASRISPSQHNRIFVVQLRVWRIWPASAKAHNSGTKIVASNPSR